MRVVKPAVAFALVVGMIPVLLGVGCGGDDGSTIAEGTVEVQLGDQTMTVALSAEEADDEVSGTADISDEGGAGFSIELECAAERKEIVLVGGSVSESDIEQAKVGTRSAVFVEEGEPDRLTLWFEDPPPAGDCDAFLRNIPDEVLDDALQPVEGDIETG